MVEVGGSIPLMFLYLYNLHVWCPIRWSRNCSSQFANNILIYIFNTMQILIAIYLQKNYWAVIEWMDIDDIQWIVNRIEYDRDEYEWWWYITERMDTLDMKYYF